MNKTIITVAILLFVTLQVAVGQCKIQNTFFKNGEVLTYDMYFKLGFTSTKAGKLILSVSDGSAKGKGYHKMTFLTNTSGIANSLYSVHDTLYAYTTKEIVPVAYIKNAMEGGDFTQEELDYNYTSDGKVDIRTKRTKNGEFRFDEKLSTNDCIYDMVSVVYYARTLDFANMKKGDKTAINFISGKVMSNVEIECTGTKRLKAHDGKKYDTIELTLVFVAGEGQNKNKEMMKVYISNDKNRIPMEITSNLKKIGAVRGIIKSYSGLRNVD